jgi:hypothetical protein
MPIENLFIGSVIFGLLLSFGVDRRLTINGKNPRIFERFLAWTALIAISFMFAVFTMMWTQTAYKMIVFPKYEATVVSVESTWEEVSYTDDDGDRYTKDVLMHRAVLSFYNEVGQVITQRSNIKSRDEPVIGEKATVAYQTGETIVVVSLSSIGLIFVGALLTLILGYALLRFIAFSFGVQSKPLVRFGTALVFFVIGLLCLGLIYAILSVIYNFLMPVNTSPMVFMFICIIITLAAIGYFLMRYFKKVKENEWED